MEFKQKKIDGEICKTRIKQKIPKEISSSLGQTFTSARKTTKTIRNGLCTSLANNNLDLYINSWTSFAEIEHPKEWRQIIGENHKNSFNNVEECSHNNYFVSIFFVIVINVDHSFTPGSSTPGSSTGKKPSTSLAFF